MPRRRLGLLLLLLGVATLVRAYLYARAWILDRLLAVVPNCDERWIGQTPAAFAVPGVDAGPFQMPDYEVVTIPSRDAAISLSGWYIGSDAGRAARAVVIVHGHNSCKREDRILLAAGMLHRHGISVLLIDLRNHGDSTVHTGRFAGGTREYRDALGAWDWLVTAKGFDPAHVGLMGFSLGAATAVIAAGIEPRVAATWADSGFADLEATLRAELARSEYPRWFASAAYLVIRTERGDDLTSLSPAAAVAKLNGRPLYIVHGTADTRLSVQYANDLAAEYRTSGGTIEPWIVEGSGHTEAIVDHAAEYERRLVSFFLSTVGTVADVDQLRRSRN
jgi:dipeptidyl aminopeptidase/acylaminoacyl peptidase